MTPRHLEHGRIRLILKHTETGVPLVGETGEYMIGVFERHPEAAIKKHGCTVLWIEVGYSGVFDSRCFYAALSDGTKIHFSYHRCLRSMTLEQRIARVCRRLVFDDMVAVRQALFAEPEERSCPITGVRIYYGDSHVDHAPPWTFAAIVARFLEGRDAAALLVTEDLAAGEDFVSPLDAAAFLALHRELAVLRVVSAQANMSVLRRRATA